VDFNLQIPANAAVFYALCGLAACPLAKLPKPGRAKTPNDQENGSGRTMPDNGGSLARSV
jgi:hypothetical protein